MPPPAPSHLPAPERPAAAPPGLWVLHGRGLAAVRTLGGLFPEWTLLRPWPTAARHAQGVLAWGRKPSARHAEAWAARRGLPVLRLEDGFLRSVGLGADEPPLSLVWDDLGIYYDASGPSRLEHCVLRGVDPAQSARARSLIAQWRAARVSKYNQAREVLDPAWTGAVLVVDQTWGDASIRCGQAGPPDFAAMLQAALAEHPQRRILLKVHPDVVAGRKRGHFDGVLPALPAADRARVQVLSQALHPPALLEQVAAVYTVSSQMGFEALLWGLPVRCFGMPFYAGWGLTTDARPAPARRQAASLEALVHAALVDYARYLHPETGQVCEVEALLSWMALQRRLRERFAPTLHAVGFSLWKRPIVRRFLQGSQVRFLPAGAAVPAGSHLVLWGRQPVPPGGPPASVLRMEDGFLRSVGLGAAFVQPLSWVQDAEGIYYDCGAPSALEQLLQTADFEPGLLARASALRARILAQGATKYNLVGQAWQRPASAGPVVLVVGQVENDASVHWGSPRVRSNLALLQAVRAARPGAWLVYKPHPDVVARLRAQGAGEDQAASLCDEQVLHAPIDSLLRQVDEVHVMTSLAGFEALLRGTPVVCWGCPFYAGWGLTTDQMPQPRRTRRLDVEALVAGVLIAYPAYLHPHTGRFSTPEAVLDVLARQASEPVGPGRALLGWAGRALARLRTVMLQR